MSREKGQVFERIAENYLIEKGFQVLDRNWHAGIKGELDLICQKDNLIVFVEIKGRNSGKYALEDGLNSINKTKAKKLLYSIQAYLNQKSLSEAQIRFDIIVICSSGKQVEGNNKIEHYENISLADLCQIY